MGLKLEKQDLMKYPKSLISKMSSKKSIVGIDETVLEEFEAYDEVNEL